MGKQPQLRATLEYEGKILYEAETLSASDTITLGRSSSCTWRIPKSDHTASAHHAAISLRDGVICLHDAGSSNGIYCNGCKIQEKALQDGDCFQIGNCFLKIAKVVELSDRTKCFLLFENTVAKGRKIEITEASMVFGSELTNQVPLTSPLVSRKHAKISRKIDGCWVQDLGSNNGTYVNGEQLKGKKERLLRDLDILSVADVDFSFHDRPYMTIRFWTYLLTVSLVCLVVGMGYLGYQKFRSNASELLSRAVKACECKEFGKAKELLVKMKSAQGYERLKYQIQKMERDIPVWEQVLKDVEEVKKILELEKHDWLDTVLPLLANMERQGNSAFSWSTSEGSRLKKEMMTIKELLDVCLNADNLLEKEEALAEQEEAMNILSAKINIAKKDEEFPEYAFILLDEAKRIKSKLEKNLNLHKEFENALLSLSQDVAKVDFKDLLDTLRELKNKSRGNIRERIDKCTGPIECFESAFKRIKLTLNKVVNDLDFSEFKESPVLTLPTEEDCQIHPCISEFQGKLKDMWSRVTRQSMALEIMLLSLSDRGFSLENLEPECLQAFENEANIDKVLGCDVLSGDIPKRNRREPAGIYDELLGIEAFYDNLSQLSISFRPETYKDCELGFVPKIYQLRELCLALEDFDSFFSKVRGNDWLLAGKVKKLKNEANGLLKKKKQLVQKCLEVKGEKKRVEIIAFGIAHILSTDEKLPEDKTTEMETEFQKLKKNISTLKQQRGDDPQEQIKFRERILDKAIPSLGGIVGSMWRERSQAKLEK